MKQFLALLLLTLPATASAKTFHFTYGTEVIDPTATFAADCLGSEEKPNCSLRAAMMIAELTDLAALVEDRSDEETRQIFTQMLDLKDGRLEVQALQYFNRMAAEDAGFWKKIRSFVFGNDPVSGNAAAHTLGRSVSKEDRSISERYRQSRPETWFNWAGAETAAKWAEGCYFEVQIDANTTRQGQTYPGAQRLLLNDEIVAQYTPPDSTLLASGFVTSDSYASVYSYYKTLFGREANPTYDELQKQAKILTDEIQVIAEQIQHGDYSQMARYQVLMQELQVVSAQQAQVQALGREAMSTPLRSWVELAPGGNVYQPNITRAVTIIPSPLTEEGTPGAGVWLRYFGR